MQEFVAGCINFVIMVAFIKVLICTSHTESSGKILYKKVKQIFMKVKKYNFHFEMFFVWVPLVSCSLVHLEA